MLPTSVLAHHLRTYFDFEKVDIAVEDDDENIFRLSLPSKTGLGTLTRWIYTRKPEPKLCSKPSLQAPKSISIKRTLTRKPTSSFRTIKKQPKMTLRKFKRRPTPYPTYPVSLLQAKTLMMEEDEYYTETSSKWGTTIRVPVETNIASLASRLPSLTTKTLLEVNGDETDCSWELIATALRNHSESQIVPVPLLSRIGPRIGEVEEVKFKKEEDTATITRRWGSETTEIISPEAERKKALEKRIAQLPDLPYDLIMKKLSEESTEIIDVAGECSYFDSATF